VQEAGAGRAVSPDGLADGIAALAGLTAAARDALGASGRRRLEANRSRAELAARYEALLDRLVDERATGGPR
jgi:hypothetical protein